MSGAGIVLLLADDLGTLFPLNVIYVVIQVLAITMHLLGLCDILHLPTAVSVKTNWREKLRRAMSQRSKRTLPSQRQLVIPVTTGQPRERVHISLEHKSKSSELVLASNR